MQAELGKNIVRIQDETGFVDRAGGNA